MNNNNNNNNMTSTAKVDSVTYNSSEQTMSLYEYLGKAAGQELGKEVYKASVLAGVQVTAQEVKTKTYTGTVMVYPRSFLEFYFNNNNKPNNITNGSNGIII